MLHHVVMLVILIAAEAFGEDAPASNLQKDRTWTDAATDRKITARMIGKRGNDSEVQLLLANGNAAWMMVSRFSADDQAYVKSWIVCEIKLLAKTVASGHKGTKWSETWGAISSSGAAVLHAHGQEDIQQRVVGVEITNRGTTEIFVLEVFWLGFPLQDKNKRAICRMATKKIKVSSQTTWSCCVFATYDYRDSTCIYLQSDFTLRNWDGLYVRSWSGYEYAGWAVRVSDGKGKVIAQQGAQPPFLGYIEPVPVPTLSE